MKRVFINSGQKYKEDKIVSKILNILNGVYKNEYQKPLITYNVKTIMIETKISFDELQKRNLIIELNSYGRLVTTFKGEVYIVVERSGALSLWVIGSVMIIWQIISLYLWFLNEDLIKMLCLMLTEKMSS